MESLRAYLDDGGPDRGALTLGGFAAAAEIWDRIESGWRELLDRHWLDRFDMRDCAEGTGAFARRRDPPEARLRIARDFQSILHGTARSGPGRLEALWHATDLHEWKAGAGGERIEGQADPGGFLLEQCRRQIDAWAGLHFDEVAVALVLPASALDRYSAAGISYASPDDVPLQAAELLTRSMNARMERIGRGIGPDSDAARMYRDIAEAFLFPTKIALGGFYDAETLRNMAGRRG